MTKPATLYHYTSQQGLVGIVSNAEFWATDIRYLNDSSEFTYAVELARRELESWKHADMAYYPSFRKLAQERLTASASSILVASLSEEGDLLSQWRGYCSPGPGFSIGFNGRYLTRLADENDLGFSRCVYEAVDQRTLIGELIQTSFERFPRHIVPAPSLGQYGDADAYIQAVAAALSCEPNASARDASVNRFVSGLLDLAAVFKNPTFNEEKEWRIVAVSGPERPLRHRLGKSFLVPYGVLPLRGLEERVINEVVVGPCPHPDLSVASLKAFLTQELGYSPEVRVSRVPFRFW